MSYFFKIISSFNKNSIKISSNTSNSNLNFQYEIEINDKIIHDEFDCGQFFVSEIDPLNENIPLTIFNPYYCGFLTSTGINITVKKYPGTTAGLISFLPEFLLDKIIFTPSMQTNSAYNIRIYNENNITNSYLTYHIDTGKIYFLNIENISRELEEFDCDWYIQILNKNTSAI